MNVDDFEIPDWINEMTENLSCVNLKAKVNSMYRKLKEDASEIFESVDKKDQKSLSKMLKFNIFEKMSPSVPEAPQSPATSSKFKLFLLNLF